MATELAPQARRWAEESFRNGFYCAESVVLALARAQGIDSDLMPQAATAFCSGMARTCGTCGALTGAIMGVSLGLGRHHAGQPVQPAYDAAERLVRQFEAEFGARDCHALLGCDIGTPEGQATFRQQRLGERCLRYTGRATEIAVIILAESHA